MRKNVEQKNNKFVNNLISFCHGDNQMISKIKSLSPKQLNNVKRIINLLDNGFTIDKLEFIIDNIDLLYKFIFDKNKLNTTNLNVLKSPFYMLIDISPIVAKHCYKRNLVKDLIITTNALNTKYISILYNVLLDFKNENQLTTLELYLTHEEDKIPIHDIVNSISFFCEIEFISPNFFKNINLNSLYLMALKIFYRTNEYDAYSALNTFVKALQEYDENTLNNISWFCDKFDFIEKTTLDLIVSKQFWNSDLFLLTEKEKIISEMLQDTNCKKIMDKSTPLALKCYMSKKIYGIDINLSTLSKKELLEVEKLLKY